jgi:hypothetical protein
MMNRATGFLFFMLMVSFAGADTLTLHDGQVIQGRLTGFSGRKFSFAVNDGATYFGYPLDIKSIVPDSPVRVSMKFSMKQYESVDFIQFDQNTLRLKKNGQILSEPVVFLKSMQGKTKPGRDEEVAPPAEASESSPTPPPIDLEEAPKPREWQRSGKWREIEEDQSVVISRGEVINIDAALKRGLINVVQFHHPRSLTSVREGNYVQALASKKTNRIVLLKVVVQDFNAPILSALSISGLPQFWIYNAQGKLVRKLTDRFTEGDIDSALKDALRIRSL